MFPPAVDPFVSGHELPVRELPGGLTDVDVADVVKAR
jgi:hypothetical protein